LILNFPEFQDAEIDSMPRPNDDILVLGSKFGKDDAVKKDKVNLPGFRKSVFAYEDLPTQALS